MLRLDVANQRIKIPRKVVSRLLCFRQLSSAKRVWNGEVGWGYPQLSLFVAKDAEIGQRNTLLIIEQERDLSIGEESRLAGRVNLNVGDAHKLSVVWSKFWPSPASWRACLRAKEGTRSVVPCPYCAAPLNHIFVSNDS
jgi:hypothetical protein